MATGKDSVAITFYVGLVNIFLALLWGALYGFGILESKNITSPKATIFYVGTMFAVGFGIIFPTFEKTMSGKRNVNTGLALSIISLLVYGGYVGAYLQFQTLLLPFMRE
ncbi:MAG: hypothetical protein IT463_03050 [Planctomycetes bacterium]|nr:hypothetical protein [Planctomycetota bacterium]